MCVEMMKNMCIVRMTHDMFACLNSYFSVPVLIHPSSHFHKNKAKCYATTLIESAF